MPFQGPKKSRFTGPNPSNAPQNDVAPLETITYRAIKTTGTLIVLQRTRLSRCRIIWLLTLTSSPLSLQQVVSLSQSSCVLQVELTGGREGGEGLGEEPNQITAKKVGPL